MIIFSPSIRSGPANTAGSENSIPEEKPTKKKLACVGVEDREGEKGRGIGKRESSLPSSLSPSPLSLQAKKKRENFRPFLCSLPLSLSPIHFPYSPFLPIPYPFRRLLHRLFFVSLYFCGMIVVRTRAISVEVTHGYSSPVTRADQARSGSARLLFLACSRLSDSGKTRK